MSLAEAAEVAVRLKLDGLSQYTSGMKTASAATAAFGKEAHKTTFAVGQDIGTGINKAVKNIEKLGLAVGGFLVAQVKFGIDSLDKLEAVTTQTNAVIRSTHGAAGLTADAIANLANKYEDLNATIDNKVIQSGENLLLTFTSIRKDAFEPTLQAALDMNQAMGGGEGGLQNTIIQVGKALQDPIRGITALRRVGVNFSEQQMTQIKDLVKHNKLYEAQKLILAELTKEFGGSFAAAGKTSTAVFAHLGDAVEDLQASLATALLPAITDVAKELDSLLRDPATIAAVKDFGAGLARAFKDAVKWAKSLDWNAIGGALRTAAGAAKGLVDAFIKAPAWLQTAVLTGWGLNKLTGGAVTNIFGDIAKGLGEQFLSRGASPANPLWVQSVTGGGIPGSPGGVPPEAAPGLSLAQKATLGLGATFAFSQAQSTAARLGLGGNGPIGQDVVWSDELHKFVPVVHGTSGITTSGAGTGFGGGTSGGGGGAVGGMGTSGLPNPTTGFGGFAQAIDTLTGALTVNSRAIEKAWSDMVGGAKGVAARSLAKFGKAPTAAAVAKTLERDQIRHLQGIEKSNASNATKLERLKAFAADLKAHGDTKTAAKVDAAIKDMKAKIATSQQATTTAVTTGSSKIVTAVNAFTGFTVQVQFSASDVGKTITKKKRYGNADPNSKSGSAAI